MTFHYDSDPLRPQVEAIMNAAKRESLSPEEAYFYQLRCALVANLLFGAIRWDATIVAAQPHIENIIRDLWATHTHFTEASKPLVAKGRTAFLDTIAFHVRQLGMQSIEVGQYAKDDESIPRVAYYILVFTQGACDDEKAMAVDTLPYRDGPVDACASKDPVYLFPINGQSPSEAHTGTSIEYLFDNEGQFLRILICA